MPTRAAVRLEGSPAPSLVGALEPLTPTWPNVCTVFGEKDDEVSTRYSPWQRSPSLASADELDSPFSNEELFADRTTDEREAGALGPERQLNWRSEEPSTAIARESAFQNILDDFAGASPGAADLDTEELDDLTSRDSDTELDASDLEAEPPDTETALETDSDAERETLDADALESEEPFAGEDPFAEDEALEPEELGLVERQVPVSTSPTLGFEFDLNFGFEEEVATAKGDSPPSGWQWPGEGLRATDHEWKDSAGAWKDAIQVTMDAVRMEVSTAPFHIDDDSEFERIVNAVHGFGKELKDATKTRQTTLTVGSFGGHPTTFTHPRTVVNQPELNPDGTHKFPGDAEHAAYKLAPVPLVIHRMSGAYPTSKALWASPQATITLPLDKFGALVWLIHETRGGDPGVAFTGNSKQRLGLREDLAWLALTRAVADQKKKLGTLLSDGTTVTNADSTRAVTCLVTILVMYMLTSVTIDERDHAKELFAKGSLPLNVKTPLWQIHKFALTDRERLVFKELYGAPAKRVNLYQLAKPGATTTDGTTKLFPYYTHVDVERFFTPLPTWETLVEAVIDEKPAFVTKANDIFKKKHKLGDEILIAPLSNKIVWDKTKPRIAVEMRRLGFNAVHFSQWRGLMKRLRKLATQVNS